MFTFEFVLIKAKGRFVKRSHQRCVRFTEIESIDSKVIIKPFHKEGNS